jgi:hypothetical protein
MSQLVGEIHIYLRELADGTYRMKFIPGRDDEIRIDGGNDLKDTYFDIKKSIYKALNKT